VNKKLYATFLSHLSLVPIVFQHVIFGSWIGFDQRDLEERDTIQDEIWCVRILRHVRELIISAHFQAYQSVEGGPAAGGVADDVFGHAQGIPRVPQVLTGYQGTQWLFFNLGAVTSDQSDVREQ